MAVQEFFHRGQTFVVVEDRAAVQAAVDHFQLHGSFGLLVGSAKLQRLVDRHLGTLIPVQQKQGRIVPINVEYRAGKAGESGHALGVSRSNSAGQL